MKGYYRYIYFNDDMFWIVKNNEWLLSFNDVCVALAHRDMFEECNWDWDVYIEREVDENKYCSIELPPYKHDDLKYIFNEGKWCRGQKPYTIRKRINGKIKRFGRYKSLDEAILMRDEIIANGWCTPRELKRKKREKLLK